MSFFTGMLGFGFTNSINVSIPDNVTEQISQNGDSMRDGEQFRLYSAEGGLSGITYIELGGIELTDLIIEDDNNLTAVAPSTGYLFSDDYTLVAR
jgi:hypothetical protein